MKKHKKLKIKSLCKLDKKEIEANLKDIAILIGEPKYICSKCARVAANDTLLCKPVVF